jgi:hypothetical protein
MSFERLIHHRAMRFCALICLSLLLLAFICAPIHKHDTAQDASCVFCHATTRAEWQLPAQAPALPVVAVLFLVDKNVDRALADDAALAVLIPRAPPV